MKKKPKAKAKPILPDLEQEALLWKQSGAFVFGVDEAGRGCLAGPVCAGVSCWAPLSPVFALPVDVRDSKLMSHEERTLAYEPIKRFNLAHGVGYATAAEIDRWNILRATYLAVARALEAALLSLVKRKLLARDSIEAPLFAFLIDGNQPMMAKAAFFAGHPDYKSEFPLLRRLYRGKSVEICVVKGDSKVFSIACASVLAKVSRDKLMVKLHRKYPVYGFKRHKGYSTPEHMEFLREHGPCFEHRQSFSPVYESASLFS